MIGSGELGSQDPPLETEARLEEVFPAPGIQMVIDVPHIVLVAVVLLKA